MNIVIIGAGLAGMGCAIALTQAGHAVSLVERHPDPHAGGGGMVLWPNASFVLDQLGLLESVAAVGGVPRAMRRLTRQGDFLQTLDIGRLDQAMGYPSIAILRRDLVRILHGWLVEHGVPVRFGVAGMRLEAEADGQARLECSDGGRITADLLLGADGRMQSVARQFVLGENAPRFQHFVNWVGALEADEDLLDVAEVQDFWGSGERFGVVSITPRKLYWAAAVTASGMDALPPFEALHERFAGWPAPIPQLLQKTRPDQVRLIPVHDVDPAACWHRANVLMLGDAAHGSLPTSGQGAAQALEDAWHLPRCLAAHPDSLEEALAAFTALRAPKTAAMTHGARQFARAVFEGGDAGPGQASAADTAGASDALVTGMARGWGAGLPLKAVS